MMVVVDNWEITLTGKEEYEDAPGITVDSVVAVVSLVMVWQAIVSRNVSLFDKAVMTLIVSLSPVRWGKR